MTYLKNRTAIITGSSGGLGKKASGELAKQGVNVVINYNSNESEAQLTLQEILSMGGKTIAVKADVSKKQDVIYLCEKAIEHFGKIDLAVNNAGIIITKNLQEFSENEYDPDCKH